MGRGGGENPTISNNTLDMFPNMCQIAFDSSESSKSSGGKGNIVIA